MSRNNSLDVPSANEPFGITRCNYSVRSVIEILSNRVERRGVSA